MGRRLSGNFGDYTEPEDVSFLNINDEKELWGYVNGFKDISDDIIPAFEKAFDVEITKQKGWSDRKLTKQWDWLFK